MSVPLIRENTGGTDVAVGDASSAVRSNEPTESSSNPQAFWEAVVGLPFYQSALIMPPPTEVSELTKRSTAVVSGTVTGLEIVSTEWRPSPDLENAASRGVIRVQVQVSEVLVGELATPEITWQMPAWIGDPAYSDEYERTVQEAIGMGPIGARAVLFLTAADAPAPTFSAYSGVLEANGASVRVDFGRYSPHDSGSDFASVATLEAAVRSAIGRG